MNHVDIGRYSKKIASFLWDNEPRNRYPDALWCLGTKHTQVEQVITEHPHPEILTSSRQASSTRPVLQPQQSDSSFELIGKEHVQSNPNEEQPWPESFLSDFSSCIWMTYRSNFPPIPRSEDPKAAAAITLAVRVKNIASLSGFVSDTGWGCMIRSGQSLLANTLLRTWTSENAVSDDAKIVSLFADDPRAPFSIHNFVNHGAAACGTFPGQWFGPSATAVCIEALTNQNRAVGLKVYATDNSPEVFTPEFLSVARSVNGYFTPTLLLISTRLGLDHVTPVYREAVLQALKLPQSMGIAGGRPSSSHYFVGLQASSMFYLDPHTTRPALPYHEDTKLYSREELESIHTRRLRALNVENMDPSMLFGFLFKTEQDWIDWRLQVESFDGKRIFHIVDSAKPMSNQEESTVLDDVSTFDTEGSEDDHEDF